MADFKTHITTSTVLGAGYAAAGFFYFELPIESCLIAGGLCSVAGMLPDLDSDSGRPVHEITSFAAAGVPMLMLERFDMLGWTRETTSLVSVLMYLVIRFGVGELFKRYTVHRGMWHSLPACITCGLLTFLAVSGQDLGIRLFKSAGTMVGFMSHLVLDEIWSFSLKSGRLNIKRSFGTAIKFLGDKTWPNYAAYAVMLVSGVFAVGDPMLMENLGYENRFGEQTAQEVLDKAMRLAGLGTGPQDSTPLQR